MTRLEDWLFWILYRRFKRRTNIEMLESMQSWLNLDIYLKKRREISR